MQIQDRIKDEFNFANNRAATIARTEVGATVEAGKHEGRKQAGVPLKSWLWSRREKGRQQHARTEQKYTEAPIPLDDDFVIAGTTITCPHPRATGVAEQDINCGCTTLSRYPDDNKDAGLLAHRMAHGFLSFDRLERRIQQRASA